MPSTTLSTTADELKPGVLVAIRGQKWAVSEVDPAEGSTLVALQSVEDGRYDDTLEVAGAPRHRITFDVINASRYPRCGAEVVRGQGH